MSQFEEDESGLIVGNLLIHGVEIVFDSAHDPRGRTWIPFAPGSNLLYGRNGAGKSTIVQAVRSALGSDPAPPNCRVDLYFEFLKTDFTVSRYDDDGDGQSEIVDQIMNTLRGGNNPYSQQSDQQRIFTQQISQSYWWEEGVRTVAISDWETYAENAAALTDDPDEIMLLEQWVSTTWGQDEGVTLAQARVAYLTYRLFEDESFWDGDDERPNRELVVEAHSEIARQNLYCLSKIGDTSFASIAAKVSSETPSTKALLEATALAVETESEEILERVPALAEGTRGIIHPDFLAEVIGSEFLNNLGPTMGFIDWDQVAGQFIGITAAHPYLRVRSWNEFSATDLSELLGRSTSMTVLDLDQNFSAEEWIVDHLNRMMGRRSDSHWEAVFSGGTADKPSAVFESSSLDDLHRIHVSAGSLVRGTDVGLSDIRLRLNEDLRQWLVGNPGALECLDSVSGSWVEFGSLSDAQRKIVSICLRLQHTDSDGESDDLHHLPMMPIILGDETDRGLHQNAVRDLHKLIAENCRMSFVTTHSPVALSLPGHRKVHVHRGADARLEYTEWFPDLRAVETDSRAFGVDKIQLLAAVQAVLIVEGAHDEAVFDELLAAISLRMPSVRSVLVVPMHGHKGVMTIADSLAWMKYTDAKFVIVVDNSNLNDIDELSSRAVEMQRNGSITGKIIKDIGLPALMSTASPEEKSILSLIEQAIRNGNVDRIHTAGLSKRDIIEYLPTSAFGLEDDWGVLRKDYEQSRLRTDFKSWLREVRGARISVERVRAGAAELDSFPEDLSRVVSTVSRLVER